MSTWILPPKEVFIAKNYKYATKRPLGKQKDWTFVFIITREWIERVGDSYYGQY